MNYRRIFLQGALICRLGGRPFKAGSWRRPSDPTCAPHVHLSPDSGRRPNRRRRLGRRTSAAARSTQTPVEPCRPRSPSTISRTAHPNRAACPATPGEQGWVCELESRERNCELLRSPLPVAQTCSASTRGLQVFVCRAPLFVTLLRIPACAALLRRAVCQT